MLNNNLPPTNSLHLEQTNFGTFSFYLSPIKNKYPNKTINFLDAYNLITGADYMEITKRFRSITDPKEKKKFKTTNFTYVTFCGEFTERAESKLVTASNLFTIDLDHLGVNLNEVKERLKKDVVLNPLLLFTSPSGNGLKVVLGIDYNELESSDNIKVPAKVWKAINEYFSKKYSDLITPNDNGDFIDPACKDISRACFLCHDADAFIKIDNNFNLLGQEFINQMKTKELNVSIIGKSKVNKNETTKINLYELANKHTFKDNNHHPQLISFIGAAIKFSIPKNQIINYINKFIHISPDSRHAEGNGIEELVENGYNLYSQDDKEIIYLTTLSIGFKLFRFNYSKTTERFELVGMLWDEVRNELHRAGFAKRKFGSNYCFIKVNGCIIYECSSVDMRDYMTNIIMSMNNLSFNYKGQEQEVSSAAIREIFLKSSNNFFNDKWLEHLQIHDKPIIKDTKDKMYFFFKNCLVTISKDAGLQQQQWGDIEEYCVWGSQIIQRDYSYIPDFKTSHFYSFIQNVTNKDNKRFETMKTALGYSLHHFYSESEGQALIFLDETITNLGKPMGGTGKGLIINALKQLRNVAKIDGKHFDAKNRFCWEMVTPSTQIVWIDDIKPDFDFSILHSNLTDGWTIEKKHLPQFYISSSDSPKTAITSNSVISREGTTNIRRQFIVELSDFYSSQIVNGDEKPIEFTHGCVFFSNNSWDSIEWNMFYGFLFECALQYLTTGLVSHEGINIEHNRFRQATDEDFVEWVSGQEFIKNIEYCTSQKYKDYILQFYGDGSIAIGQKKFTNYIKSYATLMKWTYNRVQKNGNSYFYFT